MWLLLLLLLLLVVKVVVGKKEVEKSCYSFSSEIICIY